MHPKLTNKIKTSRDWKLLIASTLGYCPGSLEGLMARKCLDSIADFNVDRLLAQLEKDKWVYCKEVNGDDVFFLYSTIWKDAKYLSGFGTSALGPHPFLELDFDKCTPKILLEYIVGMRAEIKKLPFPGGWDYCQYVDLLQQAELKLKEISSHASTKN